MVRFVLIALLILTVMSAAEVRAEEISFESEVRVKREGQNDFEALKSGETLKMKPGDSALVSTAQGLPMLVYSPRSSNAKVNVSDVNLEVFAQDALKPQLQKATREIINGLRKSDTYIQRREYDQALSTIAPLRAKYPSIAAILFASGTANYLTNHKSAAVDDLQKGLEIDPDDAAAKKLLGRLKEKP